MKKKLTKLSLNRETIAALGEQPLQEGVRGAVGTFRSCYGADTCFSCQCSDTCQTIFTCGHTCWCV